MFAIGNIYSIWTYLFESTMNVTSFKRYNKYLFLTSKSRQLKIKSIVFLINLNRHITSVSKMASARSLRRLMTFFLPDRPLDLPLSWSHCCLLVFHSCCTLEILWHLTLPIMKNKKNLTRLIVYYYVEKDLSADIRRASSWVLLRVANLLCSSLPPPPPKVNPFPCSFF